MILELTFLKYVDTDIFILQEKKNQRDTASMLHRSFVYSRHVVAVFGRCCFQVRVCVTRHTTSNELRDKMLGQGK